MFPQNPNERIGNQSIEQLEHNPRLIGIAESILQQNARILEINFMIASVLLPPVLIMKTEIFKDEEDKEQA